MSREKIIKVIHLPTTVGGNPQGISKHLKMLGLHSETWTLYQSYTACPADKVLLKNSDWRILKEIKRFIALKYIFTFDAVFFNNANTLLTRFPPNRKKNNLLIFAIKLLIFNLSNLLQSFELFLLKKMNRPIFVQFQGDDIRQSDFCLKHFKISAAHYVDKNYYSEEGNEFRRSQIKILNKYANKLYALNPDLLYVLPKRAEFLPYSHVNLEEWQPIYNQTEKRPLRIGHAPTNRKVKGTEFIIRSVNKLKDRGYVFEFILIENIPNDKAKEIYKTLDIMIDQLLCGWYGGLAVECMALGKPVITYIREDDLHFIPEDMRQELPFIRAEPSNIEKILEDVLNMSPQDLLIWAKKSRAFVEKWHDPVKIAQRIKNDLEKSLNKKQ